MLSAPEVRSSLASSVMAAFPGPRVRHDDFSYLLSDIDRVLVLPIFCFIEKWTSPCVPGCRVPNFPQARANWSSRGSRAPRALWWEVTVSREGLISFGETRRPAGDVCCCHAKMERYVHAGYSPRVGAKRLPAGLIAGPGRLGSAGGRHPLHAVGRTFESVPRPPSPQKVASECRLGVRS